MPTLPRSPSREFAREVERGAWRWEALALALATIAIIQIFKRFPWKIPGPVVALVVVSGLAHIVGARVETVGTRYVLPHSLPPPALPDLRWSTIKEVLPDSFTIALLGAIESLLAAVVADGMLRTRHDSNQELVGQGLANVASALFGGIAATGAIARTATNVQNGGRTPVASLVHVGVVLLALLLLSPYIGLVPMSVLAGILVVVAWNMSERHQFMRILKMPRADASVMLATFSLTILVNLTVAVFVGLLLAVGILLHNMASLTRTASVDPFKDEELQAPRFSPEEIPPNVVVYSIDGPFFFGAADEFAQAMSNIAKPPRAIVLRMRNVPYMDSTALHALEVAVRDLKARGSRVVLAGIQSQPMEMILRGRLTKIVGDENIFRTTPDALRALREERS